MTDDPSTCSCIILAGGRGRRAGGADKGLLPYEDNTGSSRPLIEHVIAAIKEQVDDIVISANRNIESYKKYAEDVINDASDNYRGPLAGILACLKHCHHQRILVVACDMPHLPADLVTRLSSGIENNEVCIATVDCHHQLAMLLNNTVYDSLKQALDNDQLKLIQWVNSIPHKSVGFDDTPDSFLNLNQLQHT